LVHGRRLSPAIDFAGIVLVNEAEYASSLGICVNLDTGDRQ
jgi:hypothetical protein